MHPGPEDGRRVVLGAGDLGGEENDPCARDGSGMMYFSYRITNESPNCQYMPLIYHL